MKFTLTPIAQGIAHVFALMRHFPHSILLVENRGPNPRVGGYQPDASTEPVNSPPKDPSGIISRDFSEVEARIAATVQRCGMCGYVGVPSELDDCPRCKWDEMVPVADIDRIVHDEVQIREGSPTGRAMQEAIAGTSAALRDDTLKSGTQSGGPLSSNSPRSEVKFDICENRECLAYIDKRDHQCQYCGAPHKPKRIRSRHKPLTDADIVAGGVYVPKRGNDKTAPILVHAVEANCDGVVWVSWSQRRVGRYVHPMNEFLSLVARRTD